MTSPSNLDARYGRKTRSVASRRWLLISAAVAGLALVATWYLWANPNQFGNLVKGVASGYAIIDDQHISVTFTVTSEPGRPVACALKAQDLGFNVVGWKVFEYPATSETKRTVTEQVLTVRKAVSGLVAHCWLT